MTSVTSVTIKDKNYTDTKTDTGVDMLFMQDIISNEEYILYIRICKVLEASIHSNLREEPPMTPDQFQDVVERIEKLFNDRLEVLRSSLRHRYDFQQTRKLTYAEIH